MERQLRSDVLFLTSSHEPCFPLNPRLWKGGGAPSGLG